MIDYYEESFKTSLKNIKEDWTLGKVTMLLHWKIHYQ